MTSTTLTVRSRFSAMASAVRVSRRSPLGWVVGLLATSYLMSVARTVAPSLASSRALWGSMVGRCRSRLL